MTRAALALRAAATVALLASAVGCGGGQPSPAAASARTASGERLWRSKCGACHVPVRPGSHGRGYLERALGRHRSRVRMSDAEWGSVVDYLARPDPALATSR